MSTTQKKISKTKQLEEEIKQLKEALSGVLNNIENKPKNDDTSNEMNRWVKIVHLQQLAQGLTTHVVLSNRTIDFNGFGEERSLRFSEFEEIISRYKSFFDSDILCVSSADSDLAKRYELKTEKDQMVNSETLKKLSKLSLDELEKLYKNASQGQKSFLTKTWCMRYYDGDSSFADKKKVDLLNELSNGVLENILSEIVSKNKNK